MNALLDAESALADEMREIPGPLAQKYWPSRVQADRFEYGNYATEGERFYAPNIYSDDPAHVYEITSVRHSGDLFSLVPCYVSEPKSTQHEAPVRDPQHTDTISDLAGALEAGELIHLPDNTLKTIDGTSFLSIGSVTVAIDDHSPDLGAGFGPLDPPNGPAHETIATLESTIEDIDRAELRVFTSPDEVLNAPQTLLEKDQLPRPSPKRHRRDDIVTGFQTVQRFSKWTFEDSTIREWVESVFQSGDRILNATAGKTKLKPPMNGEIVRNDLNPDRDADLHVDVGELAAHLEEDSFDVVIFDPPWSIYQSNLRYEGRHVTKDSSGTSTIDLSELPFETPSGESKSQLGHARLAKENFDHLLKPGGIFIQLTFHGTAMPSRLDYERLERIVFDPIGEGKAVIGSIDLKEPAEADQQARISRTRTDDSTQESLGSFG